MRRAPGFAAAGRRVRNVLPRALTAALVALCSVVVSKALPARIVATWARPLGCPRAVTAGARLKGGAANFWGDRVGQTPQQQHVAW